MAILSLTDQLTSLEVARRSSVSDDARKIVEELVAYDELMTDAPLVEANEGTVHTTLVRTLLPHGEHRAYNEGVGRAASLTKTKKDVISNIEIYSEVDAQMIEESPHPDEILRSEQVACIEGLSQDISYDIMYGNHDADERYTNGFAHRLNAIHNTDNFGRVISLGGTGNNLTSVYLIKWGMDKTKLIYPRGSKNLGIYYKNLGEVTADDGNGKKHQILRSHFRVSRGLSIGHAASVIRLCNIDITANNIGEKIAEYVVKELPKLARGAGTVSIACNAELKGILNWTANQKQNVIYKSTDPWTNDVFKIGEGRIRETPSILLTESQVS